MFVIKRSVSSGLVSANSDNLLYSSHKTYTIKWLTAVTKAIPKLASVFVIKRSVSSGLVSANSDNLLYSSLKTYTVKWLTAVIKAFPK